MVIFPNGLSKDFMAAFVGISDLGVEVPAALGLTQGTAFGSGMASLMTTVVALTAQGAVPALAAILVVGPVSPTDTHPPGYHSASSLGHCSSCSGSSAFMAGTTGHQGRGGR